jgi:hypothetical protein
MTFAARTLGYLGGTGVVASLSPMGVYGSGVGGAVSISFHTDGTISYTGGTDGVGNVTGGISNWYLPTTTSIGNSYYIKFVLVAGGDAWTGGIVSNTVYQLSTNRSITWGWAMGTSKAATVTISIYSNLAGTTLLGTGSLDMAIN